MRRPLWLCCKGEDEDSLREAAAHKIIELAKAGERDPERLCEGALKAMQPMAPVLISDPIPLFRLALHRWRSRILELAPVRRPS